MACLNRVSAGDAHAVIHSGAASRRARPGLRGGERVGDERVVTTLGDDVPLDEVSVYFLTVVDFPHVSTLKQRMSGS